MFRRLFAIRTEARARFELWRFHRAEMREAGVTDAELTRFVNGY